MFLDTVLMSLTPQAINAVKVRLFYFSLFKFKKNVKYPFMFNNNTLNYIQTSLFYTPTLHVIIITLVLIYENI